MITLTYDITDNCSFLELLHQMIDFNSFTFSDNYEYSEKLNAYNIEQVAHLFYENILIMNNENNTLSLSNVISRFKEVTVFDVKSFNKFYNSYIKDFKEDIKVLNIPDIVNILNNGATEFYGLLDIEEDNSFKTLFCFEW